MPARALIIAIENYPDIVDFAKILPGTHDSAKKFLAWVKASTKFANIPAGDEPKRIIVCSDDPAFPGRTHGARAQDIRLALKALWQNGANKTEELFIFVSGHGFLFKESDIARAADVLVAADFGETDVSGAQCLRLDAIQQQLLTAMGPGNHYYFVDACRNEVSTQDIQVGPLGVALPRSSQRDAEVFSLFSTNRLSIAPTASAFTDHLVDGLAGKGRAKRAVGGVPPTLRVVWANLLTYMKDKMPEVDGPAGGTNPGLLWEAPLATKACVITIDNAGPTDKFALTPRDSVLRPLAQFPFEGPSATWEQPPDDYWLTVTNAAKRVSAVDPVSTKPVDLYENCTARFAIDTVELELDAADAAGWSFPAAELVPETTLTIVAPQGSLIKMSDPATGVVVTGQHEMSQAVRPNACTVVEVFDHENTLIARQDLNVDLGGHKTVDVRFADTPLRQAITSHFPSGDGGIDFSESLQGAVTDPDLCVWLSIIAASRVLGPERFDKLGPLPLKRFDDITPGQSALYVLAGFEDDTQVLDVGVGRSALDHRWFPCDTNPQFPGLFELKVPLAPGGCLVSFAVGHKSPETIASYLLPNRATVITLTTRNKQLKISQLMLPIRSLEAHLDPVIRQRLPDNPLRAVKFVSQSQRMLERRRSVTAMSAQRDEWLQSLHGKWLDPMMAIVASYELIRQGQPQELGIAVKNLTEFFGDLPDATALKKMMHPQIPTPPPAWPPMVTDGFTAFPEETFNQLPQSKLEYTGLWTTWRHAVTRAGIPV